MNYCRFFSPHRIRTHVRLRCGSHSPINAYVLKTDLHNERINAIEMIVRHFCLSRILFHFVPVQFWSCSRI